MEKHFRVGETSHTIKIDIPTGSREIGAAPVKANIGGRDVEFLVNVVAEGEMIISREGKQFRVFVAPGKPGELFVHHCGTVYTLTVGEHEFATSGGGSQGSGRLIATMPGKMIKVLVELGQEVKKNQPVLIMESMKMEITQTAHFDGKVEEINVTAGQQVDAGVMMIRIEPDSSPLNGPTGGK